VEKLRSRDPAGRGHDRAACFYPSFFWCRPRSGGGVGPHEAGAGQLDDFNLKNENMKIIRAKHLGMCFGVRDAISLALERAEQGPLTIFGELVHNKTVLDELDRRGIRIEHNPASVSTG